MLVQSVKLADMVKIIGMDQFAGEYFHLQKLPIQILFPKIQKAGYPGIPGRNIIFLPDKFLY